MSVALILDFPGGTRVQYDQVVGQMDLGGYLPPGALFHAAGSYEGGWRVVDVWQDLPTFERFRDERIMPLTAQAGMKPPAARVIDVRSERSGSGARPALVQIVHLPGFDEATFGEVNQRVLPDDRLPDAMTFHVNGPEEGGWVVISAWESTEARDRFVDEQVLPALQGTPLTGPPPSEELPVEAALVAHSTAKA
jgi:hypothetical protein